MGISFSLAAVNMIEMYRENKIEKKIKNKNAKQVHTKNIIENDCNKNKKEKNIK